MGLYENVSYRSNGWLQRLLDNAKVTTRFPIHIIFEN